jgi:hypothetical protein
MAIKGEKVGIRSAESGQLTGKSQEARAKEEQNTGYVQDTKTVTNKQTQRHASAGTTNHHKGDMPFWTASANSAYSSHPKKRKFPFKIKSFVRFYRRKIRNIPMIRSSHVRPILAQKTMLQQAHLARQISWCRSRQHTKGFHGKAIPLFLASTMSRRH